MPVFEQVSELPCSAEDAYQWHLRQGAFLRLAPPWERIELLESQGVSEGAQAHIRMWLGPIPQLWIAEHEGIVPGQQFQDRQLRGPFAAWLHTHRMEPLESGRCRLIDHIEYRPPLGFIGAWLGGRLIRRQLARTFAWRHDVTRRDLLFHASCSQASPMNIAIGGSTGLVGSALVPFLQTGGHTVTRLSRQTKPGAADGTHSIAWDPAQGTIDAPSLEGIDAVIHLGGHNIAHGRWTAGNKRLIRDSRLQSTSLLAKTLAGLKQPPKVFLCASAIGYYGDRGQEVMSEASPSGTRFISEVCRDWEAATLPAVQAGIRVINLRIGVVLSPQGGALQKMLLPFKLGGGGIVGSGQQWWSWISLEDLPRIILHGLQTESLRGPVNAVAPGIVTNRDFTKTLGRVLRRPTVLPLPAFVVKTLFGEMGEELMLGSTRVVPEKLIQSGYQFAHPDLESALRGLLGRT